MKKIIFHIGPHKTATTYIQKRFVENRKYLASNGIYYPEEGIGPLYGHHQIIEDLNKERFSLHLVRALEFTQYHTVIFSSENFDRLRQLQIEALKEALPEDVKVSFVYFIRRSHELLLSSWQEYIKHGGEKQWAEYLLEHTLRPYMSPLLNHFIVLKHYGDAFGFENIHLMDYNYLVDSQIDVFSFLLDYLGCQSPNTIKNTREIINKSYPYDVLEVIRSLNVLCKLRLNDSKILSNNPQIRRSEAFKYEMAELKEVVSQYMVSIRLDNVYFATAMHNYFQQKLSKCIWATPCAEDNGRSEYLLPDSSWVFQDQAVHHLEELFKLITHALQENIVGDKLLEAIRE
jgi:hypothetical protein